MFEVFILIINDSEIEVLNDYKLRLFYEKCGWPIHAFLSLSSISTASIFASTYLFKHNS